MMFFLLTLVLGAAYVVLTQDTSLLNMAIALVIGHVIAGLVARTMGQPGYISRGVRLIRFVLYFLYILSKANLQVAWEIITPGYQMTPRIIRYPVDGLTDAQVTTLANAITLTPGTLSADIDEDRRVLYIHCMYAEDRDAAIADLDELRDRLLREVFGR